MVEVVERLRTVLAEHYAVDRELGRGGMATVYLARDLKHGRLVAIKVLRPTLAESLGPGRFLREIRIASRLTHPNILPVHDSGEAEGLLFYVMPYVGGESLRDLIRREGQLPVEDAVRIAQEVAQGLTYAHGEDVVHRDISFDLSRKVNYLFRATRDFVLEADPELAQLLIEDNNVINEDGLTWEQRARRAEAIMLRSVGELGEQHEQALQEVAGRGARK